MAGGRPTTYDPSHCEKADEYLQINKDEIEDYHKTRGDSTNTFERKVRVRLPTIEGFAGFIDADKTSLYEWEKLYPQFSHALDKIRSEQKKRLLEGGLSGDYNPTIAKLVLSANHGMNETQQFAGKDGKELPTPIINVYSHLGNQQDNSPHKAA